MKTMFYIGTGSLSYALNFLVDGTAIVKHILI